MACIQVWCERVFILSIKQDFTLNMNDSVWMPPVFWHFVPVKGSEHNELSRNTLHKLMTSSLYPPPPQSFSLSHLDDAFLLMGLNIADLYPDTTRYITYEGSITIPPCYETSTWILINKPVYVTQMQVPGWRINPCRHTVYKRLGCNNNLMHMSIQSHPDVKNYLLVRSRSKTNNNSNNNNNLPC